MLICDMLVLKLGQIITSGLSIEWLIGLGIIVYLGSIYDRIRWLDIYFGLDEQLLIKGSLLCHTIMLGRSLK